MSDPFERLVVVESGYGAYERAMYKAVREYGLDIQLNQMGWDETTVTFLVEDAE